ncbi:MAG: hypothetical protein IPJ85_17315 [Flavobacteriales bacterium]|nr:hypothetical protein [Flavobacteriales bacterium]
MPPANREKAGARSGGKLMKAAAKASSGQIQGVSPSPWVWRLMEALIRHEHGTLELAITAVHLYQFMQHLSQLPLAQLRVCTARSLQPLYKQVG